MKKVVDNTASKGMTSQILQESFKISSLPELYCEQYTADYFSES